MRKILDHFLENWIRYGFEAIVVVTGVWGAFALNNWNEIRKDKKQEKIVLQQLVSEFRYNRAQLNNFMDDLEQAKLPAQALYKLYAVDPIDVSIEEFDSLFVNSLLYQSFEMSQAVLNEVVNSGRFSLVRNDSLRFLIIGWQGIVDKAEKEDHLTYDYIEQFFRYSLDHFAWRNSDRFDETMIQFNQGDSQLKPSNLSALKSFEFENRTGQLLWYFENVIEQYQIVEERMDQIILLIDKELK